MQNLKWVAVCGLTAALSTACADSSRSVNVTAPSAVAAQVDQNAVSDGVSGPQGGKPTNPGNGNGKPENPGNGNGNGKPENPGNGKPDNPGNGNGKPAEPGKPENPGRPDSPAAPSPHAPTHSKVEIEGLIGGLGAAELTVGGQSVQITASTMLRRDELPIVFGDLQVGDRVHVRALRVTDGAVTILEASDVNLQNPVGHEDDDDAADPLTPLVAVVALDATAVEGTPDAAIFLLSRSGDTASELTVTIALTGTAANGVDYDTLPLTVTFAAGDATANVQVVARADALADGAETVTLTVVDGPGYLAGAPATATVGIAE